MKILTRFAAFAGALAMLLAGIASASAATTADATVQITVPAGAGLTASIQNANLGSYTYSFTQQTATGSLTLGAKDDRGTAAGWNVVLSAGAASFNTTPANITPIPVGGLSITAGGTVTTNAGNSTLTGQTRPGIPSVSSTTPAKVWTAAIGSGDGDYTMVSNANLVIPAGTLVGTYKVTLIVEITSGP